jgi:hypothetical protein
MKMGDKVRVKEGVVVSKTSEGRENNKTAIVRALLSDIEGGVQTDRDLCGLRYWNAEDLEVVEGEQE